MQRQDYTIKIRMNMDNAFHPWTIEVISEKYKDSQEFSGKSLTALFKKADEWMADK